MNHLKKDGSIHIILMLSVLVKLQTKILIESFEQNGSVRDILMRNDSNLIPNQMQNRFVGMTGDHFVENHFVENHFVENHFTENHFVENHFVRTAI